MKKKITMNKQCQQNLFMRPMTERELYAANELSKCSFPWHTNRKRFAENIASTTIATEKQIKYLWQMIWQFKRQIQDEVLVLEAYQHIAS